jgi:hypothetical protein
MCLIDNGTLTISGCNGPRGRRGAFIEPQEIAMISYRTVIAAAALALVAGTAHAEGLSPSEGRSIHLGDVAGVAYYTVDRDGFRVTATLVQGEAGTPVRVVGTLASGQSLVLSIPHEVGTPASTVAFRREGDQILVEKSVGVD